MLRRGIVSTRLHLAVSSALPARQFSSHVSVKAVRHCARNVCSPPVISPVISRAFTYSSSKGKAALRDDDVESEDVAITLLEVLMTKRELLMARVSDVATVPSTSANDASLGRELSDLSGLHHLWSRWTDLQKSIANILRLTSPEHEPDEEMRNLALEEASTVLLQLDALRSEIRQALLSDSSSSDNLDAIVEVRPGVGGQESSLFTGEVARMYMRYCEGLSTDGTPWQVETLSSTSAEASGGDAGNAFKEVILSVKGRGAYAVLQNEAGVHRVQRIPVTQSTGKLQSSTIAVVVLPGGGDESGGKGADDVVDSKDVKTEVMRSRGAGGQHVNKTESAIRLTHEPTGITVSMQDSRSQHQNRTKAWAVLRARLLDRKMREEASSNREARRNQVSGMDRSDRIRTYNFPQDRVTDHRVPFSISGIDTVMEGSDEGLGYLLDVCRRHRQKLRLEALLVEVKEDLAQLQKQQ